MRSEEIFFFGVPAEQAIAAMSKSDAIFFTF